MSGNIRDINNEKSGNTKPLAEAIRRARQQIRNNAADQVEEPEALASGDMKKFLDEMEKDRDDQKNDPPRPAVAGRDKQVVAVLGKTDPQAAKVQAFLAVRKAKQRLKRKD